jgi:DNA-binding MarR family transcriptional regulator
MATNVSVEVANRLRPAVMRIARALRREGDELGITGGQAAVLGTVMLHPELGVRELAGREGMSAPAMSRYLNRIEAAGWLERRRDPEDARRVQLHLTSDGFTVLRSLKSRRTAWLTKRLDTLTKGEREAIDAAIPPLLKLLDEDF